MATKIKVNVSANSGWELTENSAVSTASRGRRRGAAAQPPVDSFLQQLEHSGNVEVVHSGELSRAARPVARRGAVIEALPVGPVTVDAETAPDEIHVLMVRHLPSQAITFHYASDAPQQPVRRGARPRTTKTIRFSIPVAADSTAGDGTRRGVVTAVLKTTLLKVSGKLADMVMPSLSKAWEEQAWKNHSRVEGWKLVTQAALQSAALPVLNDFSKISKDPAKPNLLLIHGTFSNALESYNSLATTLGSNGKTLFQSLADVYEDRIFAFDHFSVSKTPKENAQDLLDQLPAGQHTFDVVTHSRGGLVLRNLAELQSDFGQAVAKFNLRRVALVASPNNGTPLASPARYDVFVNLISNIVEIFPENPFSEAVSFVSNAIGWLAHRVGGAIPGLAAMDQSGVEITRLETKAKAPASSEYSALVSDYQPSESIKMRLVAAGVSAFFGMPNDLVVPTEGGWKTSPVVPGDRIGCFGGNIPHPPGDPVLHTSFFNRKATVDFLKNALSGEAQGLAAIDPAGLSLPHLFRRAVVAPEARPAVTAPQPIAAIEPTVEPTVQATKRSAYTNEIFHLSVVDVQQVDTGRKNVAAPEWAILIATFRNARVVEKMLLKGGDAGKRFQKIIQIKEDIKSYIGGSPQVTSLPAGDRLVELGTALFEMLFQGNIRRLYDVARAEQMNERINLIFTSQVAWLADLPLEFVYDPTRKTFLATSEVNFTRNVVTAVPAELLPIQGRALRILVVAAQPLGLAHLAIDEEKGVILSGFRSLIVDGLATVEVLLNATPMLLHRDLGNNEYDILHFIGHGEYDRFQDKGYLIFQTESGGMQRLDSDSLQQIICRRQIRLVFLNACETGMGGHADFNSGVAPALVQAGVPAVIGNQYSVLDVSATAFAQHLYWSLGQGHTIGDAAREARVAVNYLITGEAIDWAVPVLFARDPAEKLCEGIGDPTPQLEQAANVQRAVRRSAGTRKPVGLWDVQRVIPHLDQIAKRLTDAQQVFFFEPVYIPAPLGTWRREASGGIAYLHAEEVENRIKDKPRELGVEKLIAFTNLPLSGSGILDVHLWNGENIAICSTYGFLDQIDRPSLSIERMVANDVVGFVSSIQHFHKKGPKDCPMFYNEKREIEWVAGPLHFCEADEKRIEPQIREAVKALLRVYD